MVLRKKTKIVWKVRQLPLNLPSGKKCAVCLTFDFDSISLWLGAFGYKTPGYISRGEYGARVGAPRILALLRKYNIRSTWFITGHTVDTYPEIVKRIYDEGHEIAHHGYLHEWSPKSTEKQERKILEKGIRSIERVTGEKPKGYRNPNWDLTDVTLKLLLEYKFVYDSSLFGDDYNLYKVRMGDRQLEDGPFQFGEEVDLIEIPVSWSLDDFPHFEYAEWLTPSAAAVYPGLRASSHVYENWIADYEYMYNNVPNGFYSLTLHPQVIARGHRITMLERLIKTISGFKDVWFTRMIDLAKAWRE